MPLAHSPTEPPAPIGSCLLCDEHMTGTSNVVTTECGHVFHRECLQNYLRDTPMCPICESTAGFQVFLDAMPGPSTNQMLQVKRIFPILTLNQPNVPFEVDGKGEVQHDLKILK